MNQDQWQDAVAQLSAEAFAAEEKIVAQLLKRTETLKRMEGEIAPAAHKLAEHLRKALSKSNGIGVEAFLAEYGLDTREGIAVMCLAEALLRIPDAATAQALVRDKFSQGAWDEHLGQSDSLFVNAASWGLLLTGKVVDLAETKNKSAWNVVSNMARKLGEPTIHIALTKAMRFMGGQFVLGENIGDALNNSKAELKRGYRYSYDILGEGARTMRQADAYLHAYEDAIPRIAASRDKNTGLFDGPSISVKLSGLHPRYSLVQHDRVMQELFPRLMKILVLAKQHGICVALDAEEANRLDISLLLFHKLAHAPELAGWNGLGYVAQAYGKRVLGVISLLGQLAETTGRVIPVRLVKGAYWDTEVKFAQVMGLPDYPVFTRKHYTDLSYLAAADAMLSDAKHFYCQFGTHNARTAESVLALARHYGVGREGFEFQRLHGMGEALHEDLKERAASRIYAPIGAHKDLLAYLIRRLLENGANTSFVHLLLDKETTLSELLADPIAETLQEGGKRNPYLPLPKDIYGLWKNSAGVELGYLAASDALLAQMKAAKPLPETKPVDVETAMKQTQAAFADWAGTPVQARAAILETMADALEAHLPAWLNLLAEEAGKTLPDGIAEVREAADFCRYYAHRARLDFAPVPLPGPTGESNSLTLGARGTFGCISPWNFPLAIFLGQIAAALVCGNSVVAKPAEQTPRIGLAAVALFRACGLPEPVLQIVVGEGETVGAALVAHPHIAGIAFTGSDVAARHINRALAAKDGPIVPLIAETGGLNAMIVDSSALLEQATDDILISAFGSTGQRCSALRVLYAQEDIAEELWTLVSEAMAEMRLGQPALATTDLGPVIDAEAQTMLNTHIEKLKASKHRHVATPMPADLPAKHYVAPHLFELKDASELQREVFGPVLHMVRFKGNALPQTIARINQAGYGLTFGMHSRIDAHVAQALHGIHAGNNYINRSMIGATVGVQPFGGEGLSGTGPKAGGPHYLSRFCTERTHTINVAAIGGNLALLQGD